MTTKKVYSASDAAPAVLFAKQVADSQIAYPVIQDADGNLNINAPGHLCEENSFNEDIGIDGVKTGVWQDTLDYNNIIIGIKSTQDSATDGLDVQWSHDGINVCDNDKFSIVANVGKVFTFCPARRYIRTVYTNGGVAAHVDVQTIFKRGGIKPSSHRIFDSIVAQDDAELVKAVITGLAPDGTFKNVLVTNSGNQKISIEEFESAVSVNGNTQLRTTLYDEGGIPISVDNSTETLQVISYEHHEIHSGSHYFISDVEDLAINNVFDMQFQTPDTASWVHLIFTIECEAETLWYIYEDVTFTATGSTIVPFNNNRNSANTSGTIIYGQPNTSLANANADTNITGSTILLHGIVGAGRVGGAEGRDREIILKQNTLYCMRAIATAAGYIDFNVEWYEHTDKH